MDLLKAALLCNCLKPEVYVNLVKGDPEAGGFTEEEVTKICRMFNLNGQSEIARLKPSDFTARWDGVLTGCISNLWVNYLFPQGGDEVLEWRRLYHLSKVQWRGDTLDRASIMIDLLVPHKRHLPLNTLKQYIGELVQSFFLIMQFCEDKDMTLWTQLGVFDYGSHIKPLVNYMTCSLEKYDKQVLDLGDVSCWLDNTTGSPLLESIVREVASLSLNLDPAQVKMYPRPVCFPTNCWKSLLHMTDVLFLASHLPNQFRNEWRLEYSNQLHGESFVKFVKSITNKGPTFLIIKDDADYIFGGYTPQSWIVCPKFYGEETTFLFSLAPEIKLFKSSGFNKNFQYLNMGQHTLKNGLGLGGRGGYCGIWLETDLSAGWTAEVCSTFCNYIQLSGKNRFRVNRLEVWSVKSRCYCNSNREKTQENSILEVDPSARAILEMIKSPTFV